MSDDIKIKVTKKDDCSKTYLAQASENYIQKEYDILLANAQKDVKVEGFKQGGVPKEVIESKFGVRILEIVTDKAYKTAIAKIAETDKNISYISDPERVEPYSKTSIKISFNVQSYESINVRYKNISVKMPQLEIIETDIDKELNRIAKNFAKRVKADENKPLDNDDIAIITFVGTNEEGEVVKSASMENYPLEIGSNVFIPGFEEQLKGMKKNEERDIEIRFPKDYHSSDFANKLFKFGVTLNDIEVLEIEPIEDELAKKVNFKNLDELKAAIRKNIQESYNQRIKEIAKFQVDNIIRNKYCNESVPPEILKREVERMKTMNNKVEDENEIIKNATKSLNISYIYNDIIKNQKIEPTEDEINKFIFDQAVKSNKKIDEIKKEYAEDKDKVNYMIAYITESKAFDWILLNVDIDKYKISMDKIEDELLKLIKTIDKK